MIDNCASMDDPARPVPAARPRRPAEVSVADRPDGRSARTRIRDAIIVAVRVVIDWLAFFLPRFIDRRFAMNDAEAYWWGWQITKTRDGRGRRYRDRRFDTLGEMS
jgi:hypothetical protein